MALLLFFFPGILLFFPRSFKEKAFSEVLIFSIASSLAFFTVAPWAIKYLHISLLGFAFAVITLSIVATLVKMNGFASRLYNVDGREFMIIIVLLAVLLLRLVPFFIQIAPAGADMSMHTYIAYLINEHDGIPADYQPILPATNFGAYPAGFPTITATISLLSGLPVFRSGLLLLCIVHAFMTFALYVLLNMFFDKRTSLLGAIGATFLTRDTQWIIRWGGNPTVLSLVYFILAFSLLVEIKNSPSWTRGLLLSLFLAASFLTHPIIAYIGVIFSFLYFVVYFDGYKDRVKLLSGSALFCAALLLPYLIASNLSVSGSAMDLVKNWQMLDVKSAYYDLAGGIVFILFAAFGSIGLFRENRRLLVFCLLSVLVVFLTVMNYRFWILPFSYLLYPGRAALFFIIPLSIMAASAIAAAFKGRFMRTFLVSFGLFMYAVCYVFNSASMCCVTKMDMDAFHWIDNTISHKAVIANNYGDAGLWIPGILGMRVTGPHSFLSLVAGATGDKAVLGYIYIGSKAVYGVEYTADELAKHPAKYRRVYSNGGAQVWKIL